MSIDASPAFPMTPEELAKEIDIPLSQWPLNCHGIAASIRDLLPVEGMRIARGHYLGHVSSKSAYRGGIQQHSWLELKDGRILDPTRWAMECPETPYIYLGFCDHYDDGGRVLSSRLTPAPPGADAPDFTLNIEKLNDNEVAQLASAVGHSGANPKCLASAIGQCLKEDPTQLPKPQIAYRLTAQIGLKALIPIDSWNRVMCSESLTCRTGSNRSFNIPDQQVSDARGLISELLRHFVSVEERGDQLEAELLEYDISLEDYYDALNQMIDDVEWPLKYFSTAHQYILGIALSEVLGQGYGNVLKVERYARSMGHSRTSLNQAMQEIGSIFGMSLGWD